MKQELIRLEQWGCDIEGALPRFIQDEDFLLECVVEVARDPAFEALGALLEQHDHQQAFDAAHLLKGIISNTRLTPLYHEIVEIVEPLRKGSDAGVMQHYTLLMQKRAELLALLP